MKKPFIIFSVFIILVSAFVYSCGTKNDPPVPNHNSNISSGDNTVSFKSSQYVLGFKSCFFDTAKHYVIKGIDLNNQFTIEVHFYDTAVPPSSLTYAVVNTTTLNSGQCFIFLTDPTTNNALWSATGGALNLTVGGGNTYATVKDIPVTNVSDTSKTSAISGNWGCQ